MNDPSDALNPEARFKFRSVLADMGVLFTGTRFNGEKIRNLVFWCGSRNPFQLRRIVASMHTSLIHNTKETENAPPLSEGPLTRGVFERAFAKSMVSCGTPHTQRGVFPDAAVTSSI